MFMINQTTNNKLQAMLKKERMDIICNCSRAVKYACVDIIVTMKMSNCGVLDKI